jgi:predicted nucleic acid-binding Zn ribbon protein
VSIPYLLSKPGRKVAEWQVNRARAIYGTNRHSLILLIKTLKIRDLTTGGALRVDCGVPTYIYETTDPTKPIRNFEVKQSVHDEPLQSDPETGEAVRRIISAGYGILIPGKSVGPSVGSVGSH